MRVLVVNAGSTSLKHAVVDPAAGSVAAAGEERWDPGAPPGRHAAALEAALGGLDETLDAVGHRVVHGGERFRGPVLVTAAVRAAVAELEALAPLHNRAALEGIETAERLLPGVPQTASFDTAFHRTLPPAAAAYALPREWRERFGLRRFGFHGLSVSWAARRAAELVGEEASARLVVCHLGGGASVTAVRERCSVDTSMGFTPLGGVPMATRSGSLDPGVLLHLLRAGVDADDIDEGLTRRSGLLGLSELSADLREVLRAADGGDERARLAFEVHARAVAGTVAAMTTALGGLDCLVFTAGAGEGSPRLRAAVATRLAHLGVAIDDERNAAATPDAEIGARGAPVRTLVVRAREELVVAREAAQVVRGPGLARVGRLRAVVFDLDGVLTDTASLHRAAWGETLDAWLAGHASGTAARPFSDEDYREHIDGRSREEGVAAFLAARGLSLAANTAGDTMEADSVRGIALRKDRAYAELIADQGVSAFPGSLALVRALRDAGLATAVASASRHCAEVLAAAGIDDLFDVRVDGVDAARLGLAGKPDPALFLEAARRLDVQPAETAVIEDARSGVEAARRGGFALVVGVARDDAGGEALRRAGADLVVEDLSELDDCLAHPCGVSERRRA